MAKKKPNAPVYHVEVITKARVNAEGKWEYLVKWAGYDSSDDSWEPEENVKKCVRLLKSFWKHVGTDDEDYPPGYMVEAEPEWIIDERRYFKQECPQAHAEAKLQRQREEQEQEKQTRKRRESSIVDKKSSSSNLKWKGKRVDTSDDDDIPLLSIVGRKPSSNSKGKARPVIELTDDDDDDDGDDNDDDPEDKKPLSFVLPSLKKRKASFMEGSSRAPIPRKTPKTDSPLGIDMASITRKVLKARESEYVASESSPTSLFSAPSSPEMPSDLPSTSAVSSKPDIKSKDWKKTPRVKPSAPQLTSSSGLSTKKRITDAAMHPRPVVPPKLSDLTFKKKSSAPSTSQPQEPTVRTEPVPSLPDAPIGPSHPFLDSSDHATSPTAISDTISLMEYNDHDPFQSFVPAPEMSPVLRAPALPLGQAPVQPRNGMTEAESFLKSVMPPQLAAPLTAAPDERSTPRILPPIKPSLPRISKKWKWVGELFIDVEQDKAERLCEIILTDVTDYLREGLRLHILLEPLDSIRFKKLCDIGDLSMILPACKPSEQVARLGPQADKDAPALTSLASYLESKNQFTFTPLTLDGNVVAVLLVFSFASEDLCRQFKVPKYIRQNGSLAATVVPWAMSVEQGKQEWRKPADENPTIRDFFPTNRRGHLLRRYPIYCRGVFALKFPKWLHDHMSQPNREFCIWNDGADGYPKLPYLETRWLLSILSHCRAKDAGRKADVRVVFVHVGAMKTLYKLPALVERRSRRPEIQFFTYGTHESVSPERWGIHEIFPLGGIVTFTPSAIIEDPMGVCHLMRKLAKHPLWDCYLLPSVVGMVSKLACGADDSLLVLEKGEFIYDAILNLIEQGEVSLVRAPPVTRSPLKGEEPVFQWVGQQCRLMPLQMHGILEECLKEFNELFLNVQECEWPSLIEKEISKDLAGMQMQPVIMDNFRRFVVVKGTKDDHIDPSYAGLEWVTLSTFNFRDDCFEDGKQK